MVHQSRQEPYVGWMVNRAIKTISFHKLQSKDDGIL